MSNEADFRKLWRQNFEGGKEYQGAKKAAALSRFMTDLAEEDELRTADPKERFALALKRGGVKPKTRQEIALEALNRLHGQEVSEYERKAGEEQADKFMRPSGPFIATTPEPDFAFHAPWANAEKAFQSGPIDPAKVVGVQRQRAIGSGTPFTSKDEVMAANRYRFFAPESAIDDVQDQQQRIATEARKAAFGTRAPRTSAVRPVRPSRQFSTEDEELDSIRSSTPGASIRAGWGGDGEDAEFSSIGAASRASPLPGATPVGARPIVPIGAETARPTRARALPDVEDPLMSVSNALRNPWRPSFR